jgi:hypothetical protein
MIADLMPRLLYSFLSIGGATLPAERWTWRHTCRFGRNPAKIIRDERKYRKKMERVARRWNPWPWITLGVL